VAKIPDNKYFPSVSTSGHSIIGPLFHKTLATGPVEQTEKGATNYLLEKKKITKLPGEN
jgi:hypothetical protein